MYLSPRYVSSCYNIVSITKLIGLIKFYIMFHSHVAQLLCQRNLASKTCFMNYFNL